MRLIHLISLSALFLLWFSSTTRGQLTCSPNGSGTDWHTAGNWDCGRVPLTAGWPYDQVILDQNMTISTSAVEFGGCCNPQRSLLRVETGVTLTVTGQTLTITGAADGGQLEVQSGAAISSNNAITIDSERPQLLSGGTITANSITFSDATSTTIATDLVAANITFSGNTNITMTGDLNATTLLDFQGNAIFNQSSSSTITADSAVVQGTAVVTVSGTVNTTTGFNVTNSGDFTVSSTGDLNTTNFYHSGSVASTIDGTADATGTVSNTGSSTIDGGGILTWGAYTCSGATSITCQSGGPISCPTLPTDDGIDLSTCNPVLYAPIAYFNGKLDGSQVQLNWGTFIEENNNFFIIEMAYDIEDFEEVGRVPSHNGTAFSLQSYRYSVPRPRGNGAYFRLTAVDMDGVAAKHHIVYVSFTGGNEIHVFPNPSHEGAFHLRSDEFLNNHRLFIYQASGQLVHQEKITSGGTFYSYDKTLPIGVYYVALHGPNQTHSVKLVVD